MKPAARAFVEAEFAAPSNPSSTALRRATTKENPMFAIRDLSVLAYSNGFTLWHYKASNDSMAHVGSDDFFVDAGDMMAVGDMVMVSSANGGTQFCVTRADHGSVRMAPLLRTAELERA